MSVLVTLMWASTAMALLSADATNVYTSCCSYDGGVTCSMNTWCDASSANCQTLAPDGCSGTWATSAMAIDKTYISQKSVCNAKDAASNEELGHSCLDWNAGSAPMEAAAAAYAQRLTLTGDDVPIFTVGSVGHSTTNYNMGKCFQFKLSGVSRPLIMQAVNEGHDVNSGSIDVMMGAGGEGEYLGCTGPDYNAAPMFGSYSYPGVFGDTTLSGGPATRAKCGDLPEWASAMDQSSLPSGAESLRQHCEASFALKLRPTNSGTADNPLITSRSWVACPAELVEITKLKRTDEPQVDAPVSQDSELTPASYATRMMDCCKPSAGFVANVPHVDQAYPAVMACKADGFTRMDGTTSPYASSPKVDTTTLVATTTPSATTSPSATTMPDAITTPSSTSTPATTKCIVQFFEGNGPNKKKWTYTVTADGKGATETRDFKKSNKNDEMTSLCISQVGCRVYLYKHKKLRGTPKYFTGQSTSTKNRECGTFFNKKDLEHGQCNPLGCSGNYNDEVTSFKVVAAP